MIRYTVAELLDLNRYDVTPSRNTRKVIFSHRLWKPAWQREHLRRHEIPLASGSQCSHTVTYGCINIQSVNNKFDDVMDMFCSRQLRHTAPFTVLGLTETWHDTDCAAFGRFRAAGFSVVDRARPRVRDDLSVNHGGVAIVTAPGTSVSPLPVGCLPSTFEVVAGLVTTGRHRAAVAVVYRPGSQPVTEQFFDDMAALLERLAVVRVPLYVIGDFNIRPDHDVHHNEQLRSLFDAFGLKVGTSGPTHRLGGILDLVAATVDVSLSVDSVDCSDHALIRWPVVSDPPTTPSVTVRTRSWRRLDPDAFRSRLMSSVLCQPSSWPIDVDATATLYDDTIRGILDDILPARVVVRRPRPTDPWFDAECRAAKRLTRQLERASRAACRRASVAAGNGAASSTSDASESARQAWLSQRRAYRQLRNQKCKLFWSDKLSASTNPRDMWSTEYGRPSTWSW